MSAKCLPHCTVGSKNYIPREWRPKCNASHCESAPAAKILPAQPVLTARMFVCANKLKRCWWTDWMNGVTSGVALAARYAPFQRWSQWAAESAVAVCGCAKARLCFCSFLLLLLAIAVVLHRQSGLESKPIHARASFEWSASCAWVAMKKACTFDASLCTTHTAQSGLASMLEKGATHPRLKRHRLVRLSTNSASIWARQWTFLQLK